MTLETQICGYLYRTECSCGKLYIGMSTKLDLKSIKTYLGSGKLFLRHIKANKDHSQEKRILDYYTDLKKLQKAEVQFIESELLKNRKNCLNLTTREQNTYCIECNSPSSHLKACSKFKQTECKECGSKNTGSHFSKCSLKKVVKCEECGGKSGQHYTICTKFSIKGYCEECSKTSGPHRSECSKYKVPSKCLECGGSRHSKSCSKFYYKPCLECMGTLNSHKSICSKFKIKGKCEKCNATFGQHYKTCAKYIEKKPCSECSAKSGNHKRECNEYKSRRKTS